MKMSRMLILSLSLIIPTLSIADHDNTTRDAAIGGGLGGAAGGAIGAEIGGRNGAILGSAAGAALGTAVLTDDSGSRYSKYDHGRDYHGPVGGHPNYRHCPPGQAKKGRC